MIRTEYIYVMDFGNEKIYKIDTSIFGGKPISDREILNIYGLDPETCEYMYSYNNIEIEEL